MHKLVTSRSLTLNLKYSYIPVSCYKVQNKINPVVSVLLGKEKSSSHIQLQFRLFENIVPKTSQNFKRLLLGRGTYQGRNLSLIGNSVHNVVPRAYIQLGHLEEGNCSIYGPKFRDQSFQLPHDRPGLLSCVSQQNTNNSRFLVTFAPCPFLDLKNIVFGQITAETFDNLRQLQRIGENLKNYKIISTKEIQQKVDDHHHHH